ncbi:hypothetical protein MNBD_UNCLBAC01-1160 [hydrothermal vent metagenome]|uniref:Transposase IS200-like domain-containing protein n=1 Tax=hydrothermal vent metagenome TaxID=652676 RepID=A0A3B1DM13_9ZZZZ
MSRPLRIEYPEAWYHVLNRGRRKENIFFQDADHKLFFKLIGEASRLYKLEVHAYSLMPNHYHLLVHTPEGNLSKIMCYINGTYTQILNKKYQYEGSLFKGRYKSVLVEKDEYLLELVRYIHRNPLKAGLVKKLGMHQWTSHRAYMRKKERPEWLKVNQILSRFGRYEKTALKQMEEFVNDSVSIELEEKLDGIKCPSVLGGDDFKEKVKVLLKEKKIESQDVPEYKEYLEQIGVEELIDEVAREYNFQPSMIRKKREPKNVNLRRAIILVCREDLQRSSKEISVALGGINRSVITRQYVAACQDLKEQKGCYKDVKNVLRCVEKMNLKQQNKT